MTRDHAVASKNFAPLRSRSDRLEHGEVGHSNETDVEPNNMTRQSEQKALEEYLRTAQPRLIVRIDPQTSGLLKVTPCISGGELGWDEIITEGYDPDGGPLGPVYWRVANRGEEQLYLSTFVAKREWVIKGWGPEGLNYCDPATETAVARIETYLGGGGCDEVLARLPEWELQYLERVASARRRLAK